MRTTSPGLGAPSPAPGRFWIAQVIVRDVAGGVTTNASTGDGGAPADRFADAETIDALGDRVAFESRATNLVPAPNGVTARLPPRPRDGHAAARRSHGRRQRARGRRARSGRCPGTGRRSCSSPPAQTCPTRPATTTRTSPTWPRAPSRWSIGRPTADRRRIRQRRGRVVRRLARGVHLGRLEPRRLRDVPASRLRQGRRVRRADRFPRCRKRHLRPRPARRLTLSGDGSRVGWFPPPSLRLRFGRAGAPSCATSQPVRRRSPRSAARGPRGGYEEQGGARRDRHAPGFLRDFADVPRRPAPARPRAGTTNDLLPGPARSAST